MDFTPLPHQIDAQNMMKRMEKDGCGGFLSDGMGMGKCLAPNTKVLLWTGGYKLAKNIVPGDLLIGDDSKQRTILSVCSGTENMYKIRQHKGEDYTVNESHILSLKISGHRSLYWCDKKQQYCFNWFDRNSMSYHTKCFGSYYGTKDDACKAMMTFRDTIDDNDVLDIRVDQYLKLNKKTQVMLKGYKTGVDFPEQKTFLDPYLLGAWLGDGCINGSGFTNIDTNVLEDTMDRKGCDLIPESEESITYRISDTALNYYNLRNKHIPFTYLHNSRRIRLWVLAGIIDTDGCMTDNCYEITQKNEQLAQDIAYLARSLGLFVSYKKVGKYCVYKGELKEGEYYKCVISGEGLEQIPVLLDRKKCQPHQQKKDTLLTNITIEPVGEGDYYGFTIDGNKRFLLHDFTVTHNTVTMSMFLATNKIAGKTDIIVCPFSLLTTWKDWLVRVKDWGEKRPEPSIIVYHGSKRRQLLQAGKKPDYVITTYAIIGTGELNQRSWGRVVLDESHYIKNGLRRKAPKCARGAYAIGQCSVKNWCISGTPFNNRMTDIASQALFIGTAPFNDPTWWKDHGENEEYMREWRELFVVRRTKDGMLAKPLYHIVHVEPTDAEEKMVTTLRVQAAKDFKAWKLARRTGDKHQRIKLQGKLLGMIQKLRIISNSYYSGEGAVDAEEVIKNNAKVEKMVNDLDHVVDADPKKGVVFFSQFTSFLEVFEQVIELVMPGVEVLKFYGNMSMEERDSTVFRFNNARHPRVILVSLMAGGVGLSLHHGSSTVMMSEPYYNPFAEQQAEERVHRLGQEEQVNVYRYYMNNSVENWIDGLKQKKLTLAGGLNLVKQDMVPTDFNFDDISELFQEYVASIKEEDESAPPTDRRRNPGNRLKKKK